MIVVGYAKVPATSTSRGTHEFFSVSLLVEPLGTTFLQDPGAISATRRPVPAISGHDDQ
jgi:hypothetical protein